MNKASPPQIQNNKSAPKYLQLKEDLLRIFKDEGFETGQPLPTENELIASYGVSRNTVRRTLDELEKIGMIYKKQGSGSFYAGQAAGRQKESLLIGVIVPRLSFYIYPQIIHGIDSVANAKGYNIVLGSTDVTPAKELECLERLLSKGVDGLIFEPCSGTADFESSPIFKRIKRLDIPVVILDWTINDRTTPFVSPNDVEGGTIATRHLLDAGHRKIAFICPSDTIPGQKRLQGYRNALAAAGIQPDRRYEKQGSIVHWGEQGQAQQENPHITSLVNELIALGDDRPTAIIFYNDEEAFQGYTAIRNNGLKIPDDISVIGFDDSEFATLVSPRLTSVIHPKYKLGEWAARILLETMTDAKHSETIQMVFTPSLAKRDSVRIIKPSAM